VLRIWDVYLGSRILILSIPDPASLIPDPKQHQKGEGKNFFCPTMYHKIVNNFIFEHKKFFKSQNNKHCNTLYPKFVISYQKYGFGIRDPEKPYSGSRVQGHKGTGSRIQGQKGKGSWIQGQKLRKTPDPGSGFATLDKIIG
jgi:hypothetical protein